MSTQKCYAASPSYIASKFSFNALKRLNTALRNSMAMGQVRFDSWLTIQASLIVSCTVSLKQWKKKYQVCPQPLGPTEAK